MIFPTLYAHFNTNNIIKTHKFCMATIRTKNSIQRIPESSFPINTSREHCIAYKLFAEAMRELDMVQINYYLIKNLCAYDYGNDIWEFKYTISTGWFKTEEVTIKWDFDLDRKLKEIEKAKKEEEKRNKPRRRLRRRAY